MLNRDFRYKTENLVSLDVINEDFIKKFHWKHFRFYFPFISLTLLDQACIQLHTNNLSLVQGPPGPRSIWLNLPTGHMKPGRLQHSNPYIDI